MPVKNSVNQHALAWLRSFGQCQRAQRMPGAKQQLRPDPDCLPVPHDKAGLFAKLYFNIHFLVELFQGSSRMR
jgi:hypothetical protein